MALPQHITHVPEPREAYAPYNFVPLPEKIVAAQPLPEQDRYHPNEGALPRYTGCIDCTLTTASPLYVRCGYTPQEYAELAEKPFHELTDEQKRKRAQFFNFGEPGAPAIPGSSLRGMLRALVEIAAYGKMDKVTREQLFYRSVSDKNYQNLFVEDCGRVQHAPYPSASCYRTRIRAGFLRQRGSSYIIEECDFARIDQQPNRRGIAHIPLNASVPLFQGMGPGRIPNWAYQNQTIYVAVDTQEQDYFFERNPRHPDLYLRFRAVKQVSFNQGQIPGTQEATLVITGHMQNKHMEFVFLRNILRTHSIDTAMVQRFQDNDQITQWQEQAFPMDRPHINARRDNGLLSDGEPVFFLMDAKNQEVRFFGRAQLFRLPYGSAPIDFIPDMESQTTIIDLADAMFGYIRGRNPCAGRVFVGDGIFTRASDKLWLNEEPFTPHILASPKPTTYQHYLTQTVETNADRHRLKHYASKPGHETTIRGHKLYWHRDRVELDEIRERSVQNIQEAPKQYTQFKPVKDGVEFAFAIRFENLSAVELGALLWVLRLAAHQRYRLKLGMGKPLGMGAIKVTHIVRLSERRGRYGELFRGGGWATGEKPPMTDKQCEDHIHAFEQYILDSLFESDVNERKKYSSLDQLSRIQCLLALLSWPGPARKKTRYMEIERNAQHPEGHRPGRERNGKVNEYSERLVLPTPLQVDPKAAFRRSDDAAADEMEVRTHTSVQPEPHTIRARVGGVGAQDASVMPIGEGRPGRARFAADLPRKPQSGDVVIVQIASDGRPEIITAIL